MLDFELLGALEDAEDTLRNLEDNIYEARCSLHEKIIDIRYKDLMKSIEDQTDKGKPIESDKSKHIESDISKLHLSVRAANCLLRADIKTIDDLRKITLAHLLSIRNMGKKGAEEVREKAKAFGIEIPDD